MKHLVGKKITRKVEFMEDEVEVTKLSIAEIREVQKQAKAANKEDEEAQMKVAYAVVRMAVIGAEEMTDEELNSFPPEEIVKLSEAAMLGSEGKS